MSIGLRIIAAFVLFACTSQRAAANDCPLAYPATDAGWYNSAHQHDPENVNYIAGYHAPGMVELRNFFVFDLPVFEAPVSSATLRLYTFSINSTQGMETLELRHVATPLTTLVAGAGPGVSNVFADLADGDVYGARTILAGEANTFVTIPLNTNAVGAINAAAGQRWAMGGRVSSLSPSPVADEKLFAFSSGSGGFVELVLTFAGANMPFISQQPPALALSTNGSPVTIALTACGAAPLRYQWFFNGAPLPDRTNSSLIFSSTGFFDQGDYFAVVTNSAGAVTSTVCQLFLNPLAPVITQPPFDSAVAAGFPAGFVAYAYGNPAPTYQWQFNGLNIPGATNNEYNLPSAQPFHTATFTFVASNRFGVTAASAQLQVDPLLISTDGSASFDGGNDHYIHSYVVSSQPVSYQWRFNGTNLPGATGPHLGLFNLSTSSTGAYTVVAANVFGARTSSVAQIQLTLAPPSAGAPQASLPALVGDDVLLRSSVGGTRPLFFQWYRDNEPIPGATNENLLLPNLSKGDNGLYLYVVSNELDSATSPALPISATEQVPSGYVAGPGLEVLAGDTVALVAHFGGGPPPNYQWRFNSADIPGATNAALLLSNPVPLATALYEVVVSNAAVGSNGEGLIIFPLNVPVLPARALDHWRWRNPGPQGNDLKHLAHGNGRTVAVGEGGSIVMSTNGLDWTEVNIGRRYYLGGVAFNNGVFVVLTWESGGAHLLFTSTNGVDWIPRASPVPFITAIASGNGEFLLLGWGQSGQTVLARSTDATEWSRQTMPWPAGFATAIAYGNGNYVVAHESGCFASADGVTWQSAIAPTTPHRLRFANGLFRIGGYAGSVWDSPDGLHWASRSTTLLPTVESAYDINGLAYGNGIHVAVSDNGRIIRSTDGVAWSQVNYSTTKRLTDAIFTGTQFVISGNDGFLLTSPNGVTWTDRRMGRTKDLFAIIYTNGQFVAAGHDGTILTSPTGINWTARTSGTGQDLHGLTHGGGLYVACGRNGTVITSPNGITWTPRATPTTNYLERIAWGGGRFVAVGTGGTIISSTNGIQWTQHANPAPAHAELEGVAYGAGRFMAVGKVDTGTVNALMLLSTNGTDWTDVSVVIGKGARGVAFGHDQFLVVANDGATIGYHATNATWSAQEFIPQYQNLRHVRFIAGRFIAAGNVGTVATRFDTGWQGHRVPAAQNLHDLAYGAGRIVAVGSVGVMLQSEPVSPTLDRPAVSGGTASFRISGGLEPAYSVQASTNLVDWAPAAIYTNDGQGQSLEFPATPARQFFRAVHP